MIQNSEFLKNRNLMGGAVDVNYDDGRSYDIKFEACQKGRNAMITILDVEKRQKHTVYIIYKIKKTMFLNFKTINPTKHRMVQKLLTDREGGRRCVSNWNITVRR